ncbi:DTW domain-containing protein, partial [Pseudoalteromonas sp. S1650]|uniref:DTW domain-containing protein n=1 Tax=Pseudoalteromonas sp. S1650 TaxID=579509 RepID=UPI00110A5395
SLNHLSVIDGTWKKAYKMLQLTPSLRAFQTVSFQHIPQNKYVIRKAPRAVSLSSLEGVAHRLKLIDGLYVTPLY